MIGAILVPVFTSLTTSEYQHIIDHSEAKLVFVGDLKLYKVVNPVTMDKNRQVQIYSFDKIEGIKNWKEITYAGIASKDKHYQTMN